MINYVAVGDSYTAGFGVKEEERWPNLLIDDLNKMGYPVKLVKNLAVSGFTVEDATIQELPEFKRLHPDLATLLIGANDNFLGVDLKIFRQRFKYLLDQMFESMTNPSNLIVLTIPDYTQTPLGKKTGAHLFGLGSALIKEYNRVIIEEALNKGLTVIDLFSFSQKMNHKKLYIQDGVHPSSEGYLLWEQMILPVVVEKLAKKS